jgi:hypothetical protein
LIILVKSLKELLAHRQSLVSFRFFQLYGNFPSLTLFFNNFSCYVITKRDQPSWWLFEWKFTTVLYDLIKSFELESLFLLWRRRRRNWYVRGSRGKGSAGLWTRFWRIILMLYQGHSWDCWIILLSGVIGRP